MMNERREQKDNGLQKGVELMIDNTVLLMENLSKLVALNVEDSWNVRKWFDQLDRYKKVKRIYLTEEKMVSY